MVSSFRRASFAAALLISLPAFSADQRSIHKFGRNPQVGFVASDIWSPGGVYGWPTAASTLEVSSANASDNVGGSGARVVTLEGLDDAFHEITEDVTLNGKTAVPTTRQYRRLNRMFVSQAGTYDSSSAGGAAGTITARVAGAAGAVQGVLDRVDSMSLDQTQMARYTVPAGFNATMTRLDCSADTTGSIRIYLWQRRDADKVAPPVTPKRLVWMMDGVHGVVSAEMDARSTFPPMTDLWMSAAATAGGRNAIDCSFDLQLIPAS